MTFEGFFALRRRGKENRMNGNKKKNVIIGQSVSLASKTANQSFNGESLLHSSSSSNQTNLNYVKFWAHLVNRYKAYMFYEKNKASERKLQ